MRFRNQFDEHIHFYAKPGNSHEPEYGLSIDDNGVKDVRKKKTTKDWYKLIQSSADSVNIHVILKRFQQGDVNALSRRVGEYFDATQFPTSLAEFQQQLIDGENLFNSLPVDIRAKFNHSVSEFIASIGSPEWMDIMGYSKVEPAAPAAPVESEVKADES